MERIDECENILAIVFFRRNLAITNKVPIRIMRSGRSPAFSLTGAVREGAINQFSAAPHMTAIVLSAKTGMEKCVNPTSTFVRDGRRIGIAWVTSILRREYVEVKVVARIRSTITAQLT